MVFAGEKGSESLSRRGGGGETLVGYRFLCYKRSTEVTQGEDGEGMKARGPMILGVLVWAALFLQGGQGPEVASAQGGGGSIIQSYAKLQSLPDFSLDDLQGNRTHIKEFKGQVILIHFWATW